MPGRLLAFGFDKDTRLVGLVDGLLVVLGLLGALLILLGGPRAVAVGLSLLGLGLLVVVLVFPSYYRLDEAQLVVRAGPLRWRIPLGAIRRVAPARARPCASAWSFESLRVEYRQDDQDQFILLAPRDRDRFLAELSRLAPQATVDKAGADCLERPDG